VSALPNDSRYVSPASTRAPSPMGSRAESFTAGTKGTPAKSGLSDQSVQSTGMAPDAGDTASSGVLTSFVVKHADAYCCMCSVMLCMCGQRLCSVCVATPCGS